MIPACEKYLFQFLDLQEPAGIDQVEGTVRQMSLESGILAEIIPHDVRRGGARDLSHLPQDQVWGGVAHEGIAAALGHSLTAFRSGLTQEYVGPINSNLNSLKAANPYDDPVAPIVGEGLRQAALKKDQIDEFCQRNNWDPSIRINRDAASNRIRKAAVDAHIDGQKGKESSEAPAPASVSRHDDELAEQQPFKRRRLNDENEENWNEDGEDLSDEVAEAVAMDALMSSAFRQSSQDDPVTKPGPEFVEWLSRISVSLNNTLYTHLKTLDDYLPKHVQTGNSRDYSTLLMFKRPREKEGCKYSSPDPYALDKHNVDCSALEASSFITNQSSATPPRIPCRYSGCVKDFSSERYTEVHITDTHEWVPKRCPVAGCNNTEMIANGGRYKRHAGTHRSKVWITQKCSYPGCDSRHDFDDLYIYQRHLRDLHRLSEAAQAPYLQ